MTKKDFPMDFWVKDAFCDPAEKGVFLGRKANYFLFFW